MNVDQRNEIAYNHLIYCFVFQSNIIQTYTEVILYDAEYYYLVPCSLNIRYSIMLCTLRYDILYAFYLYAAIDVLQSAIQDADEGRRTSEICSS